MKLQMIGDSNGLPLCVVTDAACESEGDLVEVAMHLLWQTLGHWLHALWGAIFLLADRGYDSDSLRERLRALGVILLSPHRRNRKKASVNDGRSMRRYQRRYRIERTFAWLHSYRRVMVRRERLEYIHYGFTKMAVTMICLNRLLK